MKTIRRLKGRKKQGNEPIVTGCTHTAADVALNQPLSQQLSPEAPTELQQLLQGQPRRQRLVLLHHGPAGVLQDQQTHVPDRQESSHRFATRRRYRPGDRSVGRWERARELKNREINNSLAEFLWFNEDVEVGFLELLCKHAEDVGGGGEISQRVDDQVEEQLPERQNRHRYGLRGHDKQMLKKEPGHHDTFCLPAL